MGSSNLAPRHKGFNFQVWKTNKTNTCRGNREQRIAWELPDCCPCRSSRCMEPLTWDTASECSCRTSQTSASWPSSLPAARNDLTCTHAFYTITITVTTSTTNTINTTTFIIITIPARYSKGPLVRRSMVPA